MRIVVKIGTQSLLTPDKTLDQAMVANLVEQIFKLRGRGVQVALISSGAVGAGRALWKQAARPHKINDTVLEKQILAAMGQTSLIETYNKALAQHGMLAAQLLLTKHDFRHRRHSVNLGRLLERLMNEKDILPVINENDSVAVEELVFTDNDELAGLLAPQVGADRLVILTDVDGVYDLSRADKTVIPQIDFEKGGASVDVTTLSGGGRGGMASKLNTAKRMAQAGITTHIARAREPDILVRLMDDEVLGTRILPHRKPKPIKRWLATSLQGNRGRITVNTCLAERLRERKQAISILPVGVSCVVTDFTKDDVVEIVDEAGKALGHGIARYDAATLKTYIGKQKMPVFIHYNALHIEG